MGQREKDKKQNTVPGQGAPRRRRRRQAQAQPASAAERERVKALGRERAQRAERQREEAKQARRAQKKEHRRQVRSSLSPQALVSRARIAVMHQRERSWVRDYSAVFVVVFLLALGLIMLYSVSSYYGAQRFGSSTYFLVRQGIFAVLGLGAMFLVSQVPVKFFSVIAVPLYVLSMALVLILPVVGEEINGAKRWIRVAGVSVQPSELVKLSIILVMAVLLNRADRSRLQKWGPCITVMLTPVASGILVWKLSNNMSSGAIVILVSFAMLFVAAPDYRRFALAVLLVAIAITVLILYIKHMGADGLGFRGGRIIAWLYPEQDTQGQGYQVRQALYAIGSGGLFGRGLGQSMQKLGSIPEAQNDMIFAVICEEIGIVGACLVIALYLLLLWQFMRIAGRARTRFSGLLVSGVIAHIAIQVMVNIAVVTNTMPNTGVTLPFISYGGTSLVLMLVEVGMVMAVARESETEAGSERSPIARRLEDLPAQGAGREME